MNMIEKRMQARGQGGFTLIELLVVVAILAILAGVVVFAVGSLTDSAGESACDIELRTIQTAASAATTEGGNPQSVTDLVTAGYLVDDDIVATDYNISGAVVSQVGPCPAP